MDTFSAVLQNDMAKARGDRSRVFDWNRAAQRIKDVRPKVASAGLGLDWDWTGGDIYENGEIIPRDETYTYLASNWAVPELGLDGDIEECWIYKDESDDWNAHTYWPESARNILAEETVSV